MMRRTYATWWPAVVVALLAGGVPAQGSPRERDVWYAYVDSGTHYGFRHVQVSRLPDGNFRYTITSRLLVDLFRAQKQETLTSSRYVVTGDLCPVSLTSDVSRLSGRSRATGQVEHGVLSLSVQRPGIRRTRAIPLGGPGRTIFDACLDDWLAGLPADTPRATIKVVDEESWTLKTVVATRLRGDAPGAVWEVDTGEGFGQRTISFDAEGIAREIASRAPSLLVRRCTEDEAKDIVHRALEGRELLTFPLDREISAPHRLRRLDVRLEWKGIPLDQFRLEDARQKITQRSEREGRYTVVVRIAAPRTGADDITFPVGDPDLRRYLAETRFIKPEDGQIIAAARKVVEGKTTAIEAVRALSAWVHGHIEAELMAETLTGPEVLACRKGKCSEYSTLFASLARSVGIPARVVLGERLVAGSWIGHMWNEAYVGRWITVDASTDEVDTSFTLLKLIESDTVMGTQALRWKLTESLSLSVVDFDVRPSDLARKYTTGIDGPVYTNVDHACRLKAPVREWRLEDKSRPGATTIRFRIPGADEVLIHFVAFSLPPGTDPKTIIDARLGMFERTYGDFTLIKNKPCEVSGAKGQTSRFRGTSREDPPRKLLTTEVVWVCGPHGYLLNLIASEAAHNKHLVAFEKLLGSFEILGE